MTAPAGLHPLASTYLKELRSAARRLPRNQRNDLIAEITAHLAEVAPATASQAQALTALERLGEPAAILEEQDSEPAGTSQRRWHETAAILLLMFGGFAFLIGWLAGVFLLWTSTRWTVRDKVIGTLVVPGGYAALLLLLSLGVTTTSGCGGSGGPGVITQTTCTSGPSTIGTVGAILLAALMLLGPLASAFYLARRAD